MHIRSLFIGLFFLLGQFISAQSLQQTEQTSVTFKIKNFGSYVKGNLPEVLIDTNFDVDNIDGSYLKAVIRLSSIDTGNKSRDKSLRSDDYFDVAINPEIKFESSNIESTGEGGYNIKGELTIKDVTKSVSLPVVVSESGDTVKITSDFRLNRRDYGVGGGSLVMSKTVLIHVEFEGKR